MKRLISIFIICTILITAMPFCVIAFEGDKVEISIPFEDIDKNDTELVEAVKLLNDNNIIKGYDEKTFAPNDNLTRAQMAVILIRLAGLEDMLEEATSLNQFTDSSEVVWAKEYIELAGQKGLVNGVAEGKYEPKATLTEEQMITMIVRVIKSKDEVEKEYGTNWPENYKLAGLGLGILTEEEIQKVETQPTTRAYTAKITSRAYVVLNIGSEEQTSAVEDTTPPVQETSPEVQETPPVQEQTQTVGEVTVTVGDKVLVVEEDTIMEVLRTKPIESTLPPMTEMTPEVEQRLKEYPTTISEIYDGWSFGENDVYAEIIYPNYKKAALEKEWFPSDCVFYSDINLIYGLDDSIFAVRAVCQYKDKNGHTIEQDVEIHVGYGICLSNSDRELKWRCPSVETLGPARIIK